MPSINLHDDFPHLVGEKICLYEGVLSYCENGPFLAKGIRRTFLKLKRSFLYE